MQATKNLLWPYSKILALAAIPVIVCLFVLLFSLTQRYLDWPGTDFRKELMLLAFLVSFLPMVLILLDFFSNRGAVIDVQGFKIDFGRINLDQSDIKRQSFGLPDNIGLSGPIVSDTMPMNIIDTLDEATNHEIVVINLKEGNAWWVTRLLALSAGAVRTHSPYALIFIGTKENKPDCFLGWGKPRNILDAILNDRTEYRFCYNRALQIARQVIMYGDVGLRPPQAALPMEVMRYLYQPEFVNKGEAVTEQIVMDQLASSPESLENPPDRLTLKRLEELFGHCLYQDSIELSGSNEQQMEQVLNSMASYIALVRRGKYDSIIKREAVEQLILKELYQQSARNSNQVK
jgi:hypothetical protein